MLLTASKQAQEESQPLLYGSVEDVKKCNAQGIPWLPILVLAIWRSAHAIYFGYIVTWITRFIILNKLADQTSVGRIAGWIEAAYSLGVLLGLAPAAYLSDTLGRKPTAITGIIFASIGTILFGFAKTIFQLVALRLFNGFFIAFLPATILTSFIELTSSETIAYAFTINTAAWRFGVIVAPFIGGLLAEPATYYPALFEDTIWERYPYALSGVVATSIPLLAVALGIFIVPETLPKDRRRSALSLFQRSEEADTEHALRASKVAPLRGLFTKRICYMLWLWFFYTFMQLAVYVAEVLFLSSPKKVGGLDLIPREMAILYIARPIVSTAVNVLVYPVLARRYSPENIFKWGVTINNTTFYASYLAFGLYAATHDVSHRVILALLLILSIPIGLNGSTTSACTQAITSRAPSKAYLARVLTAQEYVGNTGVGLGSLFGSNAWALGVTYQLLHGQAVWLAVLLLALVLAAMASRLTKEEGECEAELESEETVVP